MGNLGENRPDAPINIRIVGPRDVVPRLVVALRQIVNVSYTTAPRDADQPYNVVRFVGASDLRMTGLASVMAEVTAVVTSYTRGNVDADEAMKLIEGHLEKYDRPRRRNAGRPAGWE